LGANWSQWANIFNEVPISNHLEQIGHNSLITLLPNQYHKVPKKAESEFDARSRPGNELGNTVLAGLVGISMSTNSNLIKPG
jgi:hypothetical protein